MATDKSSNTNKATPNTRAALARSAANRQCEQCERKAALVKFSEPDKFGSRCRWCGWERAFDRATNQRIT